MSDIFSLIPTELKSYSMCLRAVRKDGSLLQFVPERFKDFDLCKAAISTTGRAYKYLPLKYQNDPRFAGLAVRLNWSMIQYVPREILLDNLEIAVVATLKDARALTYIPSSLQPYVIKTVMDIEYSEE